MNDDPEIIEEPREEIARLEDRMEELAEDLERCQKLALFSKALVAGGGIWLIAGMLGIVYLGPAAAIASIAAILGGIVLNGSNGSSMQQVRTALDAAEARRIDLIGSIELRSVDGRVEDGPRDPVRRLH